MAWHFAENTFKIFLTIDPMEAARRVMNNQRGAEERYDSIEDACDGLLKRGSLERERFIQIYGVDYHDHGNFDVIIDTTHRTPEEVVTIIVDYYEKYKQDPASFTSPTEL